MSLKKWIIPLELIFFSMVLVVIFMEIALRFTSLRYLLEGEQFLENYYRADVAKGYDIRPNVKKKRTSVNRHYVAYDVWSNELGCFDRPYQGEKELILLVGDSFTHGFAPFEEKWGTRMEQLLGYRVLKCGVLGYGTKQELLKAKEIIAKIKENPRLIVVGYYWNDLQDDFNFPNLTVFEDFLVPAGRFMSKKTGKIDMDQVHRKFSFREKFTAAYPLKFSQLALYYLSRYSITAHLIKGVLIQISPGYATADRFLSFRKPDKTELWERHERNLVSFKELATKLQAKLLIVVIPTDTQVYPFLSRRPGLDLERPNLNLEKFLKAAGIEHVDLLPGFKKYADQTPRPALSPEKDLYWQYNVHWSIRGERLAALLVARYILEKDLVQVTNKKKKLNAIEEELRRFTGS